MSEFQPLIDEMQKTNALTAELLKEKKADDTAKQLLLGNLFEILNARDLFSKQQERFEEGVVSRSDDEKKYDEKQPGLVGDAFQTVAKNTLIGSSASEGSIAFLGKTMLQLLKVQTEFSKVTYVFYREQFNLQKFMLEVRGVPTRLFKEIQDVVDLFGTTNEKFVKVNDAMIKDLGKSFKTIDKEVQSTVENIPDPATLMGGKTAKEIEEEKDKKNFFDRLITAVAHPIDTLGGLFKGFTKKFTVGNATLATAITLFVTGMAAFFPKIANFIAALSTMVGAIFTGDGEAFGKAVGENISGLFFLESILLKVLEVYF
jgi:hypothetical protein